MITKSRYPKDIYCELCGSIFYEIDNGNQNLRLFSRHLRYNHNKLTLQDYFDIFMAEPHDYFCLKCGSRVKWGTRGYRKSCSTSCHVSLQMKLRWDNDINWRKISSERSSTTLTSTNNRLWASSEFRKKEI